MAPFTTVPRASRLETDGGRKTFLGAAQISPVSNTLFVPEKFIDAETHRVTTRNRDLRALQRNVDLRFGPQSSPTISDRKQRIMADKDAATADGGAKRQAFEPSWTTVDIHRAMKRSMSPVLELQAAIETQRRDVDNAFGKPARRLTRAILGDATEQEIAELSEASNSPHTLTTNKECCFEASPRDVPLYETSPSKELLAALKKSFPGFKTTPLWWGKVESEVKERHRLGNESSYNVFCFAYPRLNSKELLDVLVADGWVQREAHRGRPTLTKNGLDVHQWLNAAATKEPSIMTLSPRKLAKEIPFSASAIRGSWVYLGWQDMAREAEEERAEKLLAEDESCTLSRTHKGKKSVLAREPLSAKEWQLKRQGDKILAAAAKTEQTDGSRVRNK